MSSKDEIARQLRSASSIATFESTDFATFQESLVQALQKLFSISTPNHTGKIYSIHHDASMIEQCLLSREHETGGIHWSELTSHHDTVAARRSLQTTTEQSKTALEAVIDLFHNPFVVPHACRSVIMSILLRVLVETPMTSPSQHVLQSVLVTLLQQCPSFVMGKTMVNDIQANLMISFYHHGSTTNHIENYYMERTHRMLSVMKYVAKEMGSDVGLGTKILQGLLIVLQNLDETDVQLLKCLPQRDHEGRGRAKRCKSCFNCGSCGPSIPAAAATTATRKARLSSLYHLHGEGPEEDDVVIGTAHALGTLGRTRAKHVTFAVGGNQGDRCNHCMPPKHSVSSRLPMSRVEISRLPANLVLLRSRVYKKILGIFSILNMPTEAFRRTTTPRVIHPGLLDSILLKSVVELTCQHCHSPSLRLCTLLLADSLSSRGYQLVLRSLWELYDHAKSKSGNDWNESILRVYAELILECSYFDTPDKCWEAIRPLANHISKECVTMAELDGIVWKENRNVHRLQLLLRCLSFLLCHRRHVLVAMGNNVNNQEFQQLVTNLSLSCSNHNWWVSRHMPENEQVEIIHTLQAVGVLGFLEGFGIGQDADGDKDDNSPVTSEDNWSKNLLEWPFPNGNSIRCAHRRMGPNIGRSGIFSKAKDYGVIRDVGSSIVKRTDDDDDRLVGTPIMEYLNDDVLQIIFSFLGYKRLVRASGICKTWKTLSENNELWKQAYHARFPVWSEGDNSDAVWRSNCSVVSWKNTLVAKCMAERKLRFKRHISGWKHRTCDHVGCLIVLRSPDQMTRHLGVHRSKARSKALKAQIAASKKRKPVSSDDKTTKKSRKCRVPSNKIKSRSKRGDKMEEPPTKEIE